VECRTYFSTFSTIQTGISNPIQSVPNTSAQWFESYITTSSNRRWTFVITHLIETSSKQLTRSTKSFSLARTET
jgi:hypothetical protein